MLIKISEKPVISMDTGRILGTIKGLIYKNNKVTFLYCKFTDKFVYIPIKDAYIGADAIMLKATEDINMLTTDVATQVYTENGEEVGTITSIEMDDAFNLTGINVDTLFIEINKVLHMGNVVIVKTDKNEIETPISTIPSSNEEPTEAAETTEDIIDYTETNEVIEEENSSTAESTTTNTHGPEEIEVQEELEKVEEVEEISSTDNFTEDEDDLTIEIDPRYNHLCGKKLLADISIVQETFEKGTIIDAPLIQFAIINNAIVKVIMNTDD